MPVYNAPIQDISFLLNDVLKLQQQNIPGYDALEPELLQAILEEGGKLASEVLAPLNASGDREGCHLENGVVRTPKGFKDAFDKVKEGGWTGLDCNPEFGGQGLPYIVATAIAEIFASANMAFGMYPGLTHGAYSAIHTHGSAEQKATYLPQMVSCKWTGTMNLTEPHCGTDLGLMRTKAEPNQDGSYAITGQKIFISAGDHDLAENIIHLVLAKIPGGPAGVKGISLFIVPKFLVQKEGALGPRNKVSVGKIEEKMGIHANATCVMNFDGATGFLLGQAHKGMRAMFTMMNNARLGVGTQGVAVAEAAFQHALAYAQERKQGKAAGTGAIIEHADVRRMLATMKADTYAARGISMMNAVAIDMATATGDPVWKARAAFLTPIGKAFGSDIGCEVSAMGTQVHGGMGFIEETGAAQFARDVRVTAIYEGTNGIQAMDLTARKLMDGGDAAFRILEEIQAGAEAAKASYPDLAEAVWQSVETLRETTEWLVAQKDLTDRFAGAVPYLRAFARVLGGHVHLASAVSGDTSRARLATFYIKRILPEHAGLLAHTREGAADLMAISADDLTA